MTDILNNQPPKVIGLVPAHNSSKFIIKTLEHLAVQDYPNLEIIICDDASTDATYEICQRFASQHSNFKVLRNDRNLGWLKTSERMWEIAVDHCDFCFSNPHDDHPTPHFVSNLVNLMRDKPNVVLAIPGMKNIYSDGSVVDSFYKSASNEADLTKRTIQVAKRNVHYWWAAYHGLHRTSAVKKNLPISKLPFGEPEFTVDLVWVVKMALKGEFVTSDQILLHKYYIKNSVSNRWAHNSLNRLALWTAILKEFRIAEIAKEDKKKLWREVIGLAAEKIKLRMKIT